MAAKSSPIGAFLPSLATLVTIEYILAFSAGDARVYDNLSAVEEVAKLSLPDRQSARVLYAKAVFKAKYCFLRQRTVGYLPRLTVVNAYYYYFIFFIYLVRSDKTLKQNKSQYCVSQTTKLVTQTLTAALRL